MLRRLCVFAGRFTLEDVEAVCCFGDGRGPGRAEALDLLSSLVDKSLVIKEDIGGAPATGCTRRCGNTPG